MRFWWVNQNKTFAQETRGGYLWSPKRKANGQRNPFYEFMREVSPGDLVLSFEGTHIRAIGVAQSFAYEAPQPPEFGGAGPNWSRIGWKVDMQYWMLDHQIRPAEHMDRIVPHLPDRYAPLQSDGRGIQSVYLTTVSPGLMSTLAELIGEEARQLLRIRNGGSFIPPRSDELVEWEEHLRQEVEQSALPETDKRQIILARRGQGLFKANVRKIEAACRITRVDRIEHLRASHIRPWRDSDNEARLDGENGLLLTPTMDHLFDRGFISFDGNGRLLISSVAHEESLRRMGIPTTEPMNVGGFSEGQRRHLEFHRDAVFLQARLG